MGKKETVENFGKKQELIYCAAELFVKKGFTATTTREIASAAGTNIALLNRTLGTKEEILCTLVAFVLESQFETAKKMVDGLTDDPILYYAVETTLQLHIAELNENIRDLYSASYSLAKTSDIIQHNITDKLEKIFGNHLPDLETKDFYELEIASGGIMRSFMTRPCDMYFTMERKTRRFLETTFKVYDVPQEKISQAIEFVKQFDFQSVAQKTLESMLTALKHRLIQENSDQS